MIVGHFSDLHGEITPLLESKVDPDLWICTGDLFPNITRGNIRMEEEYQTRWFTLVARELMLRLGGVPLLSVPGNHDYVDLVKLLSRHHYPAYMVTYRGLDLMGHRFAGFPYIPLIAGEWNYETSSAYLADITARTLASDPDILVTHAPPDGILDAGIHAGGIAALTGKLAYTEHRVKYHFFGHIHECGGLDVEEMGVHFYNGAMGVRFIEIP